MTAEKTILVTLAALPIAGLIALGSAWGANIDQVSSARSSSPAASAPELRSSSQAMTRAVTKAAGIAAELADLGIEAVDLTRHATPNASQHLEGAARYVMHVDVDGVLGDNHALFGEYWRPHLERKLGRKVDPSELTNDYDWVFTEWGVQSFSREFWPVWGELIEDGGLTRIPAFRGAADALQYLHKEVGVAIRYVTHITGDIDMPVHAGADRIKWLAKKGFPLKQESKYQPTVDVVMLKSKGDLTGAHAAIDDGPANLVDYTDPAYVAKNGNNLLVMAVGHQYNRDITDAVRITDWEQVRSLVEMDANLVRSGTPSERQAFHQGLRLVSNDNWAHSGRLIVPESALEGVNGRVELPDWSDFANRNIRDGIEPITPKAQ